MGHVMASGALRSAKRSSSRSRSIPTFTGLHPWVPLRSQVLPLGIAPLQQRNFLTPRPPLELLLPSQRLVHVVIGFPVEQSNHFVTSGESLIVMELVLEHALVKIAAHSDVQSAGQASHDVDTVVPLIAHERMIGEVRFNRQ